MEELFKSEKYQDCHFTLGAFEKIFKTGDVSIFLFNGRQIRLESKSKGTHLNFGSLFGFDFADKVL